MTFLHINVATYLEILNFGGAKHHHLWRGYKSAAQYKPRVNTLVFKPGISRGVYLTRSDRTKTVQ